MLLVNASGPLSLSVKSTYLVNDFGPGPKSFTKAVGTSCKKIHIRKKISKKIYKKIQEDTFNDPASTPYGKANSSIRPDSFFKSLVIRKFLPSLRSCKNFVRMTSDFKKLFTGPGKNYIWS